MWGSKGIWDAQSIKKKQILAIFSRIGIKSYFREKECFDVFYGIENKMERAD